MFISKLWHWIGNNSGSVVTIATVIAAIVPLYSLVSSAEQFSLQMSEQKRATSLAIVSDFISEVGSVIVQHSVTGDSYQNIPEKKRNAFERLVVTRTELLIGSLEFPALTNQLIFFLGSNNLGHLFDSSREFENLPFISLRNVNLEGTKVGNVELSVPEVFCTNVSRVYFSHSHIESGTISYADFSEASFSSSSFAGSQITWSNFSGASLELAVDDSEAQSFESQLFKGVDVLFSDLRQMRVSKYKSQPDEVEYQVLANALIQANSLYGSRLDEALIEQLRRAHPQDYQRLFSIDEVTAVKSAMEYRLDKAAIADPLQAEQRKASGDWNKQWQAERDARCENL